MINNEFLEGILDFVNMYIWILKRKRENGKDFFVYEYVSPGIERFIPVKREELIGKSSIWDDYVHPDDIHILKETLSILSNQESVHEVYRIIDKDKKIKWVESMVFPILSQEGELIGVKGYTTDITERKKQEERLKKFNKYLTTLTDISLLLLESKEIEDAANKILKILGETVDADRAYWFEVEEDIYITQRAEWVKEGITPQIDNPLLKRHLHKRESSILYRTLSKGRLFKAFTREIPEPHLKKLLEDQYIKSILIAPIYLKGRYIGFIGFDSVLSEREWKEEEILLLKVSAEMFGNLYIRINKEKELKNLAIQFETLVKSMPVLVAFRDKMGRWVYANPLAEEYIGLKGKDYIGKTTEELVDLVEEEELKKVYRVGREYDKRILEQGKVIDYILNYKKRGKEIYLHVKKNPIFNEQGDLEGILVIGIDITEKINKEIEKEKIQEKLLEMQKMKSLGLMASGIAHDFNNILTAISGNISLIKNASSDPSKIENYIKRITDAIDRAKSLIQNMFLYSGKIDSRKTPLNLRKEMRRIYEFIHAVIPAHIKIGIRILNDPVIIDFDPSQLQQVIMNLIINARDAIGKKEGEIDITIGKTQINKENIEKISHPMEMKEGEYALIEIKDNGPGIPNEILNDIFDPFFSTKSTGKGLGLSIVSGIIKASGGGINLITEEGKGTLFQIFIPLSQRKNMGGKEHENNPSIPNPKRKAKILVVDDEKWIQDMLKDALSVLGYEPYIATSGNEAIEEIRKRPFYFDLVILDYSMPGINGIETLKKIREIVPDMPIILSSGYVEKDIIDKTKEENVAFMAKPYRIDDLNEFIKRHLKS